jgi:hypothetical protein
LISLGLPSDKCGSVMMARSLMRFDGVLEMGRVMAMAGGDDGWYLYL